MLGQRLAALEDDWKSIQSSMVNCTTRLQERYALQVIFHCAFKNGLNNFCYITYPPDNIFNKKYLLSFVLHSLYCDLHVSHIHSYSNYSNE